MFITSKKTFVLGQKLIILVQLKEEKKNKRFSTDTE